jgi:putative ABC transport system permease protein
VLSRDFGSGGPATQLIGSQITVTSVPGHPVLTVVGVTKSITNTAGGWVLPAEIAALRPPHAPAIAQMLYRFQHADTQSQISADVTALTRALPAGTITGTGSWLAVKSQQSGTIAIIVPFVAAFGVIGLVMSVVIVGNVVNGAVVAGYRRIGVLKSVGFTPVQVVAAYVAQVGIPALAGTLAGVVVGNLLSVPLLSQTASVYGVGRLLVPVSVDVGVPLLMCVLVGLAALLPALRAGRLSAVQAIATGRAPRPGRGYTARRLLGRLPLPRPVTIGLAAPFARPARTAVTIAAILFGATAVIFAAGLNSTLTKAANGQSHAASEQVQVVPAEHYGPQGNKGRVPGFGSGHAHGWRVGPDGPGFHRGLPRQRGLDRLRHDQRALVPGSRRGGRQHRLPHPDRQVCRRKHHHHLRRQADHRADRRRGLRPAGTGTACHDHKLADSGRRQRGPVRPAVRRWTAARHRPNRLFASAQPRVVPQLLRIPTTSDSFYQTLTALIGTLTLLLAVAAGLGVLNTVVLGTRDRVHDLGVFKAVGMTPRQISAMVVCWIAGAGLAAGLIALPVSVLLHSSVVRAMASAGGTALPPGHVNVFNPAELLLLALAGLVIGVAGALLPASWAARARTVSACGPNNRHAPCALSVAWPARGGRASGPPPNRSSGRGGVLTGAALHDLVYHPADDRTAGVAPPLPRRVYDRRDSRQPLADEAPGLRGFPDPASRLQCLLKPLAALPAACPVAYGESDEDFHVGYISLSSR